MKSGIIQPGPNSYSASKLFTANYADAQYFNKTFDNSIIVKVKIPRGINIERILGVDSLKYIYNIPTDNLSKLRILHFFK